MMKKPKIPEGVKKISQKRTYCILREIEKGGKRETIEIYKEKKPPFRLDHRDFISSELLKKYGPGRYIIKSIDAKKKETIHFSGKVKHPPKGKVWTKRERFLYTRTRRPERRLKVVTVAYTGAIWIVLFFLLFYGILSMNTALIVVSAVAMAVVLLISALFMNIAFYETD